ncbi:GGDEF domain-containing protein [Bradyrhizobium erythrophlei]|uniref:diguanylate cyclase n=1 Tax=Bradyrhizobium erythrophlei TaxID=1437360 RepID=A0A1M5HLD4_9BRAD|nr:diguanylate cyclase (GGDEF) domain-containing protein [Bradyrhizobium erythrophlei]
MPRNQKTGAAAPKTSKPKAAKRRKNGVDKRKVVPRLARPAKQPKPVPRLPVGPKDARPAIRRLRTELARARKRIEELEASADTDFLLDIPNRRGFEREFHRAISYIKRYHASGALVVLDVDGLKPINDAFGHAAGDQVLKAVAATLLRLVRSSDVVGRLGGDEFAVLLWNLSETDAKAKAASLEQAIDRLTFTFRGRDVTAGASAGVAILGPHAEAGRALEEADSAMYVRKAQRRHEITPQH